MSKSYHHFINGQVVQGKSGRHSDLFNPSLGEVSGNVALATVEELNSAVDAAKAALPEWSGMNPQRRARVLFNFKNLVEANASELALILSEEHGKVLADSHGDIQRASTLSSLPAVSRTWSRVSTPKVQAPALTFTACDSQSASLQESHRLTSPP